MSFIRRKGTTSGSEQAPPDKQRAVLSGTLEKHVAHGGGKHARAVYLFDDCVAWYRSTHDAQPSKCVQLRALKHPPKPKLNEHGVAKPRLFLLLLRSGEQILFEAPTAAARDRWVRRGAVRRCTNEQFAILSIGETRTKAGRWSLSSV